MRVRSLTPAWPLVGLAVLVIWQPSDEGITLCPFALCTGMACPGCGLTRAMSWLVRGELGRAAYYHPLAPLIALEMALGWGLWVARRRGNAGPLHPKWVAAGLLATVALLLGLWVTRWISGTLPPV